MVIDRDTLFIYDTVNIKLTDAVLIRIEDALRTDQELLVTIDASHYGFFNGNGTVYRHDTVQYDIPSFVTPRPRPIIEKHRPGHSEEFGKVIAADYKLTDFYDELAGKHDVEGLSTFEYIDLCKKVLLPYQRDHRNFNGLAYVQVVGKLDHRDGIKKVLNREFLTVSIGAAPKRLICSECLQDQMVRMCDHYADKSGRRFMLAESLRYEELSFVDQPADPFGRVIKIHDGKEYISTIEKETSFLEAKVDVISIKDFFNGINTGNKQIVCVDNICTIVNQEDEVMAKKTEGTKVVLSIPLTDEFPSEKIKSLQLTDSEEFDMSVFSISDEQSEELTDKEFAIVQKTSEGMKRRFPMRNEHEVKAGIVFLDEATDLTETEKAKARKSIERAAKKLEVNLEDFITSYSAKAGEIKNPEDVIPPMGEDGKPATETVTTPSLEDAIETLKPFLVAHAPENLEDSEGEVKKDPVTKIFELLKWYANDVAWASKSLNEGVAGFLETAGKEAISKGMYDGIDAKVAGLEDEIKTLTEDVELLEDQNRELNFQIRVQLVDEIIASKDILGIAEEDRDADRKTFLGLSYDALVVSANNFRKLKGKIEDSAVNNKLDIKTIENPTLNDGITDEDASSHQESEVNKMKQFKQLETEVLLALKNVFKR